MQPLDVGIFQPYKHWHDHKIKEAVSQLDVEYSIRSFFSDLKWVREQTFKRDTIKHAFEKSGMWPVNPAKCIKQIKTFSPPEVSKELEYWQEDILFTTPKKAVHAERVFQELEDKIVEPLSSATKPKVLSLIKGTKEILSHAQLQARELGLLQAHRTEEIERKMNKRKVVQKLGGLTIRDAYRQIAIKANKREAEKIRKKEEREYKRILNIEKKDVYKQGVEDRRAERASCCEGRMLLVVDALYPKGL
jgi:hypothetical protein